MHKNSPLKLQLGLVDLKLINLNTQIIYYLLIIEKETKETLLVNQFKVSFL